MTDQATKIPREKMTPTIVAADAMYKLLCIYDEFLPGEAEEKFIIGILQGMWNDDRANGDDVLDALSSRNESEEHDGNYDFITTLVAACAYCMQAMKADMQGNQHEAWLCVSDARVWLGILGSAHMNNNPGKHISSKGGKARNARFDPLREYARELAQEKNFPSRRSAAMTIAPHVIELSNKLGVKMSPTQAHLTISNWISDITFGGKRST